MKLATIDLTHGIAAAVLNESALAECRREMHEGNDNENLRHHRLQWF